MSQVQNIVPGQNCPIPDGLLCVQIRSGAAADFSAFCLGTNGKTRYDRDFVFYGQTRSEDGAVNLSFEHRDAEFTIDLNRVDNRITRIAFGITSDFSSVTELDYITIGVSQGSQKLISCEVPDLHNRKEAALILGEIYRRNGSWKFRFVAQGFNGGLKPLAESFGVDISDDGSSANNSRDRKPDADFNRSNSDSGSNTPKVNLKKITLTKNQPRVSLEKRSFANGTFRVNLNWHQGGSSSNTGSFWSRLLSDRRNAIDLDLAAYIRLKNGYETIIQALGNRFGSLNTPPYIKLLGDDRTGAQSEGEWIYVSTEHFDEIEEIIIFTFIYDGVPNWRATDGVVRIQITGQPEVETRLTEGDDSLPMCAIARITNTGSSVKIERLDHYFRGHEDMDHFFGWGFNWRAGRK